MKPITRSRLHSLYARISDVQHKLDTAPTEDLREQYQRVLVDFNKKRLDYEKALGMRN